MNQKILLDYFDLLCAELELTVKIDEKEQVIKKNNEIINQLLKKIDELKNTH